MMQCVLFTCMHACRVSDEVPEMVDFIQKALNSDNRTGISEIELLMDMNNARNTGQDIEATTSNISCPAAKYSKILAAIVRQQPSECLEDLGSFYKAHAEADASQGPARHCGSEWFARLANLSFGKLEKYPWVRNAAIKANLLAKGPKLTDGVCKLITTSHLSSLTTAGNRASIKEMEKIMNDCRTLCDKTGISGALKTILIGKLDTRLMLHFCKQNKFADQQFKAMDAIGQVYRSGHSCNQLHACMHASHDHAGINKISPCMCMHAGIHRRVAREDWCTNAFFCSRARSCTICSSRGRSNIIYGGHDS